MENPFVGKQLKPKHPLATCTKGEMGVSVFWIPPNGWVFLEVSL